MDFAYLFTSFDGRINRKPYWLATIVLVVIAIIVSIVIGVVSGIGMAMMGGGSMAATIISIVITALIAYPATALMVKRLHDRGKSGQLAWVFWAPTIIGYVGQLTGLTVSMQDINGVMIPSPNLLGMIVGGLTLLIGLWALVELGFLRGTEGPNEYGPDPLA